MQLLNNLRNPGNAAMRQLQPFPEAGRNVRLHREGGHFSELAELLTQG
jgi:hypothetical protein